MKRKILTREPIDSRSIGRHRKKLDDKDKTIYEEAEKFIEDKKILEQQYEDIADSSLSRDDKIDALIALKELAILREKDFDIKVEKEREKLREEQQRDINMLTSGVEEITDEIEAFRTTPLKADSKDATSVVETLEDKKTEYRDEEEKYKEQLRCQIQQAEMQARNMRNRNFREE